MQRRSFLKSAAGFVPGALVSRVAYSIPGLVANTGTQPEKVGDNDFLALAQELAKEKRTVVGVFHDTAYAGREIPASLHPENFQKTWGARNDVRVVILDKYQIRSYSILFKGRMDILVYPYGPLYPMENFLYSAGDMVAHFLKRGGAVLTTGGVPFGSPVSDEGKHPVEEPVESDGLSPNSEVYRRWVAPLGYKYYVHPHSPVETRADREYLPSVQSKLDVAPCRLGLVANNSSHEPVPKAAVGDCYPERYPARQVTPLLWGTDKYGQTLAVNGLFIQDFENGSRRIHLAHQDEPHPLSPNSQGFSGLMADLLSLLVNRLIVTEAETNFACYRQGEPVQVRAQLASFESSETDAEVRLEIRSHGQTVDSHSETIRFPAKQVVTKEWHWAPGVFAGDEYDVVVSIRRHGQTISSVENGFVIWNDAVVRQGPKFNIQGKYFRIGASESFASGTNYWESTLGEMMWYRPNVKRVAADLRQMRECGVNYIRPHHSHLKWFKDYLLFQYGKLFPYYASLEKVESPLPDERTWRIWDALVYLCQKFGIVLCPSVFTYVPEEMGDPRGFSPLLEGLYCAEKREVQREFLRQLNLRFKEAPGITWDLWNEPSVPVDALKGWTNALRQTLEKTGAPRVITVGGGSGEKLGDAVDYLAVHLEAPNIAKTVNRGSQPAMMQEIYLDRPENLASELLQAEDMRDAILATVKNGYCGVAPWCWSREMRLWQDSYEHDPSFRMESWDDRLGTHVHDDATLKPAGLVFRNLATLLRTIRFVDFDSSNGRLTTDRGELRVSLKGADNSQAYSLYHMSGDRCFAAMALTSASWGGKQLISGPDGGHVYIMSDDGSDLSASRRIFAKSEVPGKLIVSGLSARPRSVALMDVSPLGNKTLEPLSWSLNGDGVEVTVAPTLQAYWVQVNW